MWAHKMFSFFFRHFRCCSFQFSLSRFAISVSISCLLYLRSSVSLSNGVIVLLLFNRASPFSPKKSISFLFSPQFWRWFNFTSWRWMRNVWILDAIKGRSSDTQKHTEIQAFVEICRFYFCSFMLFSPCSSWYQTGSQDLLIYNSRLPISFHLFIYFSFSFAIILFWFSTHFLSTIFPR